jgi:hypothetical protein
MAVVARLNHALILHQPDIRVNQRNFILIGLLELRQNLIVLVFALQKLLSMRGVPLKDPLTELRVVRAQILRGWKVGFKGFDVEGELNHHAERQGFTMMEVPIAYRQRLGQKKLGYRHGAEILRRVKLETT